MSLSQIHARRRRVLTAFGTAGMLLQSTFGIAQPVSPAPFPSPPATNMPMPQQQMPQQQMPQMPPQQQMPAQMPQMPGQQMPAMPGQQMPQMPGQAMPGQMPQMPGQQMPQMPGQAMPGMPGQMPQMPGQAMPGQMPQMPGQMPQMPGQAMPGQMPQMPGQQMPGQAPFGQAAPLLPEGAMDTSGMSGVRQLHQFYRNVTKNPGSMGTPQTPAGWIRTQAQQAPAVAIEHPSDWRGTLIATQNMGATTYAQGRVVSGDGRNMIEGETLANTQPIPSPQIASAHVDRLARQLGARSMLLIDDWQEVPQIGIYALNSSVRVFDTGDYIVFIVAGSLVNLGAERSGFSIGNIAYKVIVGPKQTFSQLAQQIYIPMLISANW